MSKLARAVELKTELVHFATSGRFGAELATVLDRFYADGHPADEAAAFLPVDYFAHQHRLPSGETVVDRFVAEREGLDRADIELLLSWKTVVEGVFEVRAVDGAAVLLFNLVDELVYRVFSNLGDRAFDTLAPGTYVVGRLIPLGADWLISGTPRCIPPRRATRWCRWPRRSRWNIRPGCSATPCCWRRPGRCSGSSGAASSATSAPIWPS